MNRREALATLVALPAISKISVAKVRPRNVLVVESGNYLSPDLARSLMSLMTSDESDPCGLKRKVVAQDA